MDAESFAMSARLMITCDADKHFQFSDVKSPYVPAAHIQETEFFAQFSSADRFDACSYLGWIVCINSLHLA